MALRQWDAYKTLDIMDRGFHEDFRLDCIGSRGFGQRCWTPIGKNYNQIRETLDVLEGNPPLEAFPSLQYLTRLSLCTDCHPQQSDIIVKSWERSIHNLATTVYLRRRIQELEDVSGQQDRDLRENLAKNTDLGAEIIGLQAQLRESHGEHLETFIRRLTDTILGGLEEEAGTNYSTLQNENLALQSDLEAERHQNDSLTLEINKIQEELNCSRDTIVTLRGRLASEMNNSSLLQNELNARTKKSFHTRVSLSQATSRLKKCRQENEQLKVSVAEKDRALQKTFDACAKSFETPGDKIKVFNRQMQLIHEEPREGNEEVNLSMAATETKPPAEISELKKKLAPTVTSSLRTFSQLVLHAVFLMLAIMLLLPRAVPPTSTRLLGY